MILAVIVLFVAFVVTRLLLIRSKLPAMSANIGASVVVLAFIIGSFARPFGFPSSETPPATVAASQQTPVPQPMFFPSPRDVSSACKANAAITSRFVGYMDFLADPSGTDKPAMTGAKIARKNPYIASGWAVDVDGKEPALGACLIIDGKLVAKGKSTYGILRPDVAGTVNDQKLTPVGFVVTIPSGSLPVGSHTIAVAIYSHDGTYARTHNVWDVDVR